MGFQMRAHPLQMEKTGVRSMAGNELFDLGLALSAEGAIRDGFLRHNRNYRPDLILFYVRTFKMSLSRSSINFLTTPNKVATSALVITNSRPSLSLHPL